MVPERPQRLTAIMEKLREEKLLDRLERLAYSNQGAKWIPTVHTKEYLTRVETLCQKDERYVDTSDAPVSKKSFAAAVAAVGAPLAAIDAVVAGKVRNAFCAVRPPGHHALKNQAMGFCLFNNIAIAARYLQQQHKLPKVLIIDWDVHHGNGTQACFYDEPRVGFFSAHRWPFYPGTGSVEETGTGDGLGTTRNLPVEFGTSRETYRQEFARELEDFAARIKPELVLVSAGFDSHRLDPIGSLGLEVEDFSWLTTTVTDIANTYAKGRVVSTLEGGYNPPVLAECVAAHLEALQDT